MDAIKEARGTCASDSFENSSAGHLQFQHRERRKEDAPVEKQQAWVRVGSKP